MTPAEAYDDLVFACSGITPERVDSVARRRAESSPAFVRFAARRSIGPWCGPHLKEFSDMFPQPRRELVLPPDHVLWDFAAQLEACPDCLAAQVMES